MKDMTLGAKIMMGFGIIIFIMLVLGGMGVVNMKSASSNADKLANIYAPEADVGAQVVISANEVRYGIRGFAMSDNLEELKKAKEAYKELIKHLAEAKALAAKYDLQKLKDAEAKATAGTEAYMKSVEHGEKAYEEKQKILATLDSSATEFVQNIGAYLKDQDSAMEKEITENAGADKLKERFYKTVVMNEVVDIGNEIRIGSQKAAARRDMRFLEDAMKKFPEIYSKIEDLRKVTRATTNIKQLDGVVAAAKGYEGALKKYLELEADNKEQNALRVKLAMDVIGAAEETVNLGVSNTVELSKEASSGLSAATTTMIIGLIVALIIGIVAALGIIRSITRPTIEAVRTIAEANNQVVAASDQIAASSQSLAEGASEQASSVEEVSATVEESTATNNQNAENGREADNLARAAHEAAKTGNHKIQDLMTAMEKITDSSQRIAKIIKTIDEIAFQTNLLALNAAVEAARAGEHGLGFAVVADEVKNLAQRSADAAKETAGIIEEAIEEIKNGNQIAKDTNESFAEILDKAKKTSDLIGEISASIKEQAEGMNQIATAMGQIDQVTQQNAANSEEAAAAAEELNAQALAMMQSTREIAKIVGFDIEREVGTHGTSKPTRKAPPKLAAHPHKALIEKKPKPAPRKETRKSDDDVFPLDEDDMKEF